MKQFFLSIYKDIFLLYSQFLHWNLSKICIFFYVIFAGLVFCMPLFCITFFIAYFQNIDYALILNTFLNMTFLENAKIDIFLGLIYCLFLLFYCYQYILLISLNDSYLKGKKLGYTKNYYLDFHLIKKFVLILLSIVFGSIILVVIINIILMLLSVSIGTEQYIQYMNAGIAGDINTFFVIFQGIILLGSCAIIYFIYRLYFAFVILVCDNKRKQKSFWSYLKKSFQITKGVNKIFQLILLALPIGILFLLQEIIISYFSYQYNITQEFSLFITLVFLRIFGFLFLYGLVTMFLQSFYKRVLIKK